MRRFYGGVDCLTCRDAGQVPDPHGWGDDADWLPCPARCESTIYREHCELCACGVDLEAPHALCACGAYACDGCSDPDGVGEPWVCAACTAREQSSDCTGLLAQQRCGLVGTRPSPGGTNERNRGAFSTRGAS